MATQTILDAFLQQVAERGDSIALQYKQQPGGEFVSRSWSDIHGDVLRLANLLVELGITPGDRVAQLSENRYEWILLDLAIMWVGAIHVPLHATLSTEQVGYQIKHSGTRLVFVSTQEQLDKVAETPAAALPDVFCYEPLGGTAKHMWSALASANDCPRYAVDDPANEPATILYTSGTTGEPKGVVLSHGNLMSNAQGTKDAFDFDGWQVRVGFLPLSHVYARTCDLYIWIIEGGVLALAESRESVVEDCQQIEPTFLNGVPYFYEKVMQRIVAAGYGESPGALRNTLGGRIRYCNSGGAPLPEHVYDFYYQQDVPLLQGYGLTETSPVISCATELHDRRGCAGKPIPGVDVEIHDGEIVTRGPHVMLGYWKNDEATKEIIRNGRLHTGDLGELVEGFVRITGRKKELIVTSAGKNVAPILLESLVTASEYVEQIVVVGDNRKYLTALVVPDWPRLKAEYPELGDCDDPCRHPQVLELIQQTLNQRLQRLSRHEQIARFTLLQHPFSVERGELTAKLSLRRSVIADHYAETIDSMYD